MMRVPVSVRESPSGHCLTGPDFETLKWSPPLLAQKLQYLFASPRADVALKSLRDAPGIPRRRGGEFGVEVSAVTVGRRTYSLMVSGSPGPTARSIQEHWPGARPPGAAPAPRRKRTVKVRKPGRLVVSVETSRPPPRQRSS